MQPWPDTLKFPLPLRNARLSRVLCAEDARVLTQQELLDSHYERGRIEGQRALNEQLLRQRSEVHEFFNGICRSLQDAVPKVVRDTEQSLVNLALNIARKLIADLPISAQLVEAVVRQTLATVENSGEFHVDLHPADLELLQQANSTLLSPPDRPSAIQFHSSTSVTRGGCLVRTSFGVIDARRETKIALLEQELAS
jgi:flagellar assembly protein FliH